MDRTYPDWQDLEDEHYLEDDGDSEGSEANSEVEFQLYSQLHYSSNATELEEHRDEEHPQEATKTMEGEESSKDKPLPPISDKLQLYLEQVNREKPKMKAKTRKSVPKDPKPCFEEVILIDSSPDVISISEDSGDEQGICSVKSQNSLNRHTSTPAAKFAKERFSEVTLSSSTSESDSDESNSDSDSNSDSADSDVLENWMILGRENQDGDQAISLNLSRSSHCGTGGDSVEERSWMVSDKDKEAQIYNKAKGPRAPGLGGSKRYYTDKNVHCKNCNRTGHLSKNCPEPKKALSCFLCGTSGHRVSDCPNKYCNNCGLPGHLFSFCSERAYWHKQCHRCGMTGHFFDACPEIWRQYHLTTHPIPPIKPQVASNGRSPAYCFNCSKRGHFGHACDQKRMFNGVHPILPFINSYDTVNDIKSRQHRIRLKVEALKRNGFFLPFPKASNTPKPLKKKMKIHHQSSHTPPQIPKANPNHVFFNDDNQVSAAKQKKKKNKGKESGHAAKPWKPKRPVPTAREQLPLPKQWNEEDDFPRGGGTGESMMTRMRKKRRRKKNPSKQSLRNLPNTPNESGAPQCSKTVKGQRKLSETERKERNERKKAARAERKLRRPTYPDDENLFNIKQRKRRR